MKVLISLVVGAVVSTAGAPAVSQELDNGGLVDALRRGGYVIVMRHARSPSARPDPAAAAPGNADGERQLDEEGRRTARSMGEAFRRLGIPVHEVLSSPTFRALQTARLLGLAEPVRAPELGDGGQGMRSSGDGMRSAWLREKAAEPPPAGSNRLMITHAPNLIGAFGDAAAGIEDGESLIIDAAAGDTVVARVKIGQWARLEPR